MRFAVHTVCRVGISVLLQLPKLARRVRLPYPAPLRNDLWMSGSRAGASASTAKVFLRSTPAIASPDCGGVFAVDASRSSADFMNGRKFIVLQLLYHQIIDSLLQFPKRIL